MSGLWKMEWYRSIRRYSVILLTAFLLVAAFSGMFELYSYSRDYVSTDQFSLIEMYKLEPEEELIWQRAIFKQIWAETMNANTNIFVYFVAIIFSLYVGYDFTKGRIEETVAAGYSRTGIYWSKYLVLTLLCTGLFLVGGVVHFLNRPANYAGLATAADLPFFLYYAAWAIPACFGVCAVALSIAFIIRRPFPALAVNLVVFYLRQRVIGAIVGGLTGGEPVELFVPFRTQEFWPQYDLAMLVMNLAFVLVFSLVGWLQFKKRNVR